MRPLKRSDEHLVREVHVPNPSTRLVPLGALTGPINNPNPTYPVYKIR